MKRLLDLFCGAGGAAAGYTAAGFEVVGVDITTQPHYPYTFIQADALEFPLDGFDCIHASPPCQIYSKLTAPWQHLHGYEYPDVIAAIRERLKAAQVPYVIENVPQAPLEHPILLCGTMFGHHLVRHRHFESSLPLIAPKKCGSHKGCIVVTGHDAYTEVYTERLSYPAWMARKEMGIDWMNRDELVEAIPPVYTAYIGAQLLMQM